MKPNLLFTKSEAMTMLEDAYEECVLGDGPLRPVLDQAQGRLFFLGAKPQEWRLVPVSRDHADRTIFAIVIFPKSAGVKTKLLSSEGERCMNFGLHPVRSDESVEDSIRDWAEANIEEMWRGFHLEREDERFLGLANFSELKEMLDEYEEFQALGGNEEA